jgi:hypothetical protein
MKSFGMRRTMLVWIRPSTDVWLGVLQCSIESGRGRTRQSEESDDNEMRKSWVVGDDRRDIMACD